MPINTVVSLTGARLAFGDRVLWEDLDLDVRAGEFIAVLGPNGTGKTSLLKVLLGQMSLSAGTVTVDGRPVTTGSDRIGYVPQHRSLDRGLSLAWLAISSRSVVRRPPLGPGRLGPGGPQRQA